MDPVKLKELKSYLNPSAAWVIVGAVLLVIGLMTVAGLGFSALIYLIAGGGLLWVGISNYNDVNKQLKEFESRGELERVIADFAGAKSFVKDKLRVGQYYLFGKRKCRVVRFGEIRQLWQTIHRRYGVESTRTLQYIDSQGATKTLCDLQLRKKSDDEVIQIMTIVRTRNPGVKLGYK